MNYRVLVLNAYIPSFIKKRKLEELTRLTAEALGYDVPDLNGLSYDSALERYALFTRQAAEKALRSGRDLRQVGERLYNSAYRMGEELRTQLRLASHDDVRSAIVLIYKMLKIDFACDRHGSVIIAKCFFSDYYNPEICGLISALDQGLIAGISGGWRLDFTQRITDGNDCCQGCLSFLGEEK